MGQQAQAEAAAKAEIAAGLTHRTSSQNAESRAPPHRNIRLLAVACVLALCTANLTVT
jgi:hypothetical protein